MADPGEGATKTLLKATTAGGLSVPRSGLSRVLGGGLGKAAAARGGRWSLTTGGLMAFAALPDGSATAVADSFGARQPSWSSLGHSEGIPFAGAGPSELENKDRVRSVPVAIAGER